MKKIIFLFVMIGIFIISISLVKASFYCDEELFYHESNNQEISDWDLKPVIVNIQINLESEEGLEKTYEILNEIEKYGWITSVFVSGKFASQNSEVLKALEKKGHAIGVYGWEKEDLSSLNYSEQLKIINKSVSAVRKSLINPERVTDFKPQNLEYNDETIKILQEIGMKSVTSIFSSEETFVKCPYANKIGEVTFPYPITNDFFAVPISNLNLDYVERFSEEKNSFNYLKDLYEEHNKTKDPIILELNPSTIEEDTSTQELFMFLSYVDENQGKVKPLSLMTQSQTYIPYLEIISFPESACSEERITIDVSFSASLYCPRYYFRVYGKYTNENEWSLLGEHYHGIRTGTFTFTKSFKAPKPRADSSYKYEIKAVGQGCDGVCWPTPSSYEKMDKKEIDIGKICLLFVPMGSVPNFDSIVGSQINKFISETNLASCSEKAVIKKITQSYTGDYCGKTCGLNSLKSFARSHVDDVGIYDAIIGIAPGICPNRVAGCSNGADVIWVSPDSQNIVLSHELGHLKKFGDFTDQYCSRPAGSSDRRCNDGNVRDIWNLWGLFFNKNPLMAALPYDCPPDGVTNDSIGQLCCNHPSLRKCSTVNYGVCCYGNKANLQGGRSIMSYAGAPGPRNFDARERSILNSIDKLNCPPTSITSGSLNILSKEAAPEKPKYLLGIELSFYENISVIEESIALLDAGKEVYPNLEGEMYQMFIEDENGNILWNRSFDIYFDYGGPVYLDVDYSNISFEDFFLVYKIPFDFSMEELKVFYNDTLIFSKILDFPIWILEGVVKDEDGFPVPNAYVSLTDPFYDSTMTDDNGSYQISGLQAGGYQVKVESENPNLMTLSQYITIHPNTINNYNFTLEIVGSIAGYVKDDQDNGIPDLIVYVSGYETPRYRTNNEGYYLIPRLSERDYVVNIDASDTDYEGNSSEVTMNLGETSFLNFTLKKGFFGELKGVVSAPDGAPVYRAYITLSGKDFYDYHWRYTEVNGEYEFKRLKNGTYDVRVEPPYGSGLIPYSTEVEIIPFTATYLNISLREEGVLTGYVFDYKGEPVYDAYIWVGILDYQYYGYDYTSDDGSYRIGGLETREYNLYVSPPYESDLIRYTAKINITAGEIKYFNITLAEKTGEFLGGYVFDSFWNPLANVPLQLEDEEGTVFSLDKTDGYGYFEFVNLPKGIYEIFINDYDSLKEYAKISFDEENAINLTQDLEIYPVLLKIDAELELNKYFLKNNDTITANVSVKNNEDFELIDWAFFLDIEGVDEIIDDEDIYFELVPVDFLPGETSYVFEFKIPDDNDYNKFEVFGGAGKLNYEVYSSQGILNGLTFQYDRKEISKRLPGDVNGDCKVDIFDLAAVGLAYGSVPGDDNWNANADLNNDGEINIFDLAIVGLNYGGEC